MVSTGGGEEQERTQRLMPGPVSRPSAHCSPAAAFPPPCRLWSASGASGSRAVGCMAFTELPTVQADGLLPRGQEMDLSSAVELSLNGCQARILSERLRTLDKPRGGQLSLCLEQGDAAPWGSPWWTGRLGGGLPPGAATGSHSRSQAFPTWLPVLTRGEG